MAFAGLQAGIAHRGIRRDGEHQLVDFRRAVPIVLERLVADLRVLAVVHQHERPGADRVQVDLFRRAGRGHRLGMLQRHDRREVHGEVGQERRFGMRQHEPHGQIVDPLDMVDQRAHAHAVEVFVRVTRNIVVRVFRVELPLEGIDHVVGVQGPRRREVLVAVERHPFAQVEGVGQPVIGNVPAFRQAGDDGGGAAFELDQPVEDGLRRGVERRAGRVELRVKAFGTAFGAVDQGGGLRRAREQKAQRSAQRQGRRHPCHD